MKYTILENFSKLKKKFVCCYPLGVLCVLQNSYRIKMTLDIVNKYSDDND